MIVALEPAEALGATPEGDYRNRVFRDLRHIAGAAQRKADHLTNAAKRSELHRARGSQRNAVHRLKIVARRAGQKADRIKAAVASPVGDDLAGFSFKKIAKAVEKVAKPFVAPIVKAIPIVGGAAGAVVDAKAAADTAASIRDAQNAAAQAQATAAQAQAQAAARPAPVYAATPTPTPGRSPMQYGPVRQGFANRSNHTVLIGAGVAVVALGGLYLLAKRRRA